MISFEFIEHRKLPQNILLKICTLKSDHWNYSIESQKLWFLKNFKQDDVHLIVIKNKLLIGYLSLSNIELTFSDSSTISAFGLGSVCVSRQELGKNYGSLLMNLVNYFLNSEKKLGVLLCKTETVGFYEKVGWYNFLGDVEVDSEVFQHNFMTSKEINEKYISIPFDF